MPQSQQTQMVHQQPQQHGGGGLLRSLLRPFMPEVSAGIDIASGLLHGKPDSMSQGLAMATKAIGEGGEAEQNPEEVSGTPGEVTPGDVPEANPVMAMNNPQEEMAEGGMGSPEEEAAEGEGLTPEQMASLQSLDKQFPGVHMELTKDPGLLDGASNMVNKLRYMYRKQAQQQGGVQA